MISEERIEQLKEKLLNGSLAEIEDFVGGSINDFDRKMIETLIDDTIEQMPEDILERYLAKYSPKIVVFDVDDVMHDLNRRVAERTQIPYEKFVTFYPKENPVMTEEEKRRVLMAYQDPKTFEDIDFCLPVIDLVNRIYHEYPDYQVHIISNNTNEKIRDVKLRQLQKVLDLPEEQLHMHVIHIEESKKKCLPKNIFLIVDDSYHNLKMADAQHKIMPARKHNETVLDENGRLNGEYVDRPETVEHLVKIVGDYLEMGA